jgi:nitronate monooxygenase
MLPSLAAEPLGPRLQRSRTLGRGGAVGVNFLVPFLAPSNYDDVEVAAAGARVVEFFWGEPDDRLSGLVRATNPATLTGWQVGSADEARAAVDAGCHLVVAQGVEAGGHVRGTVGLLPLLAEVLDAVGDAVGDAVCVIAAGGIASAAGVAAALEAGADAVRVGTRFLATDESAAHPRYIDALIGARGDETVLTTAFGRGWPDAPHRVLQRSVDAATRAERRGGGDHLLWTPMPPTADMDGDIEAMPLYAGQGVGAVTARRPAAEVVAELVSRLPSHLPGSPDTSGG